MKPKHFVRTAYNYDADKVSTATGLKCLDKTLTQQEFKEESNINFIAERYGLTGELPQVLDLPKYGDFTGIFDFQTAQNQVRHAIEQFMTLPAKLRAKFDNSPQKLLTFLEDPENRDEAIAMGLVNKPEPTPTAPPAPDTKGTPTPDTKAPEGTPSKPPKT